MLDNSKCITILFKRELLKHSFKENKTFNSSIEDTIQNLLICLQSLKTNASWSTKYPIRIFFDDGDIGLFELEYIKSQFSNTFFHIFPAEDPSNFTLDDETDLDRIIEREDERGKATRDLGYRRMCYWYSYMLWRHPALIDCKYIMRMDSDSVIWCKSDLDFFQIAEASNIDYLYRVVQKVDDFSANLHDLANDFLVKSKMPCISAKTDIRSLNQCNSKSQNASGYNYVFNNFFVAKASLFTNGTTSKLLSFLVDTKNIYLKRWGDANLHSILLQLPGVRIDQITNYCKFDYGKWGLLWENGQEKREEGVPVPTELFKDLSVDELFTDFKNYLTSCIDHRSLQLKNLPNVVNHRFQSTLKSCFLKHKLTENRTYTSKQLSTVKSVFSDIKGSFLGHEAVVLTCGPSLAEYSKKEINDFCKGKLVVAVKEAYLEFMNANFWFVNDSRWQQFPVNTDTTFTVYTHAIHETAFKAANNDVFYDVYLQEEFSTKNLDISHQLINRRNYKDYDFDANVLRPWGPGILYETVFYFLQHLGIRACYTLGWDLSLSGKLNHYFDKSTDSKYSSSVKGYQRDLKSFESSWEEEMQRVIDETASMYHYFKDNNLNLYVLSQQSLVSDRIPRLILTNK